MQWARRRDGLYTNLATGLLGFYFLVSFVWAPLGERDRAAYDVRPPIRHPPIHISTDAQPALEP